MTHDAMRAITTWQSKDGRATYQFDWTTGTYCTLTPMRGSPIQCGVLTWRQLITSGQVIPGYPTYLALPAGL